MSSHEIYPEDISLTKIMSNHLNKGVIWNYTVEEIGPHDLEIRGHLDSANQIADVTLCDLQDKIGRGHIHEIDLRPFGEDLDTAQGARNALAAVLNEKVDIGRIPGTHQLPLPLNGPQS